MKSTFIFFILFISLLVLFLCFRLFFLGQQSQKMQPQVGLKDGKLLPCGPKPNCVVGSFSSIKKDVLLERVQNLKNSKIVVMTDNYLHATITSPLFGFVDDLEFTFSPDNSEIFYRSSSRVGHSDLGQNKKRINQLTSP